MKTHWETDKQDSTAGTIALKYCIYKKFIESNVWQFVIDSALIDLFK